MNQEQVGAEVEALRRFFGSNKDASPPRGDLEKFVRRAVERKDALISRWGGWRFEATITDSLVSAQEISTAVRNFIDEWRLGAQLKKRIMPPLAFERFESEWDQLFCEVRGCHVPMPWDRSPLFTTRVVPESMVGAELCHGLAFKFRSGQVVSRAVLAQIRKRFPFNATYVAFWEGLFEMLGVKWAATKPYQFVLSTAPSDVLRLGTFGESSCYAPGGEWERAKLHLASMPNGCVLLIFKAGADQTKERPIGRAWGILAPEQGGAEFSNFYLLPKTQILPGLCTTLQKALNVSVPVEAITEDQEYSPFRTTPLQQYMYCNHDSILLGPGHIQGVNNAIREQLERTIRTYVSGCGTSEQPCQLCSNNTSNSGVCTCCGSRYCLDCTVEDTAKREFNTCYRCAKRRWTHCACGRATSQGIELDNGERICQVCAAERCFTCASCNAVIEKVHLGLACPTCERQYCQRCQRYNNNAEQCSNCRRATATPTSDWRTVADWSDSTAVEGCDCGVCREERARVERTALAYLSRMPNTTTNGYR